MHDVGDVVLDQGIPVELSVVDAGGRPIAGANFAPARPGETISLFGTGFGATNPPLPAGKLVTTAAPLANTVQVTIGGIVAKVPFAGVSGSGLDQLNVTIPPGLPDGDAAVFATIAGSTTQTNLFITVKH